MLWQPETNVETLSSDKSWKFKGKLKAAVNLSLLHIHFSQGLLYVALAYMTSHSASNCLINTGRKVILYLQANLESSRCCTLGLEEEGLCALFLLGKAKAQILNDQRVLPFWLLFSHSRNFTFRNNTRKGSNKELSGNITAWLMQWLVFLEPLTCERSRKDCPVIKSAYFSCRGLGLGS